MDDQGDNNAQHIGDDSLGFKIRIKDEPYKCYVVVMEEIGNILLDFEISPVFKELWQAVAFFSSAKARILQTGLYQLSMEHHGAYKYAVFRLTANILSITGLEKE